MRRGGDFSCSTGREFAGHFHQGDADAVASIQRMARYLAQGIAGTVSILAPEKVILFGGILDSLATVLVAETRAQLSHRPYPTAISKLRLVAAQLGAKAGALGASLLPTTFAQRDEV